MTSRRSIAIGILAASIGGWSTATSAQNADRPGSRRAEKPAPRQRSVAYGPHEHNVLDFWQADTESPAPLVVYIHGGGFRGGSKESLNARTLRELLEAGISVAAINYRLLSQAPLPAAHEDSRRAVQYLRWKAGEWNIDTTRVAAFGGSAGAQLCMYLAFHDDMADPDSDDPVERESSRLTCVATNGGQTTMDVDWWQKHIPGYDQPHRNFREAFGPQTPSEYEATISDISALSLISVDDVPLFMTYAMNPEDPLPDDPRRMRGWQVHHVVFGLKLAERMEELGLEVHLKYPDADPKYRSVSHFFIEKLTRENSASTGKKRVSLAEQLSNQFNEIAPKVGEPLPDVDAYDAEGNRWQLSSLKGQYSVLLFGCLT